MSHAPEPSEPLSLLARLFRERRSGFDANAEIPGGDALDNRPRLVFGVIVQNDDF
jgi:hypothetical protein